MKQLVSSGLLFGLSIAFSVLSYSAESNTVISTVPFGDRLDARIVNYNRTAPDIATADSLMLEVSICFKVKVFVQ